MKAKTITYSYKRETKITEGAFHIHAKINKQTQLNNGKFERKQCKEIIKSLKQIQVTQVKNLIAKPHERH